MTSKKMPPLPEDSAQEAVKKPEKSKKSAKDKAAPNLEKQVEKQRAQARRRARRIKENMSARSPEEALRSLVTSAAEMQSATLEIAAAGKELEGTMTEISSAARQSASAATQSTAGVIQVLQGSRVSQERTQGQLRRAGAVEAVINGMTEAIVELVRGLDLALETNSASAANVREVQKQTAEIRGIVNAVSGVADQINLFAFNAALEASRAGKHGAGFSIVADEVRNLAAKATESASNIAVILDSIETAVQQVSEDMEKSIADSRDWAAQGNEVIEGLREGRSAVDDVRSAADTIDERARELIDAMERTELNSRQISQSTESAEQATMESVSVLREQSSALRGIQEAAEELALKTEEANAHGVDDTSLAEMGTITDELSATIQEASSSASQVGAAVRQIARSAEVLARLAEENMPVVGQSRRLIEEISDRADGSKSRIERLRQLLRDNADTVASIVTNVGEATDRNLAYALNVKQLQAEVLRIDEVIDSLIGISIMTNLLSVSGRIEGVRAGESGAGFMTVAEDIRQLAEDANTNVINARRLVRTTQLSIAEVAADLEKSGQIVRGELDRTIKITAQVDGVEDDIVKLLDGSGEIASAAAQAAAAIPQISSAITSISDAAAQAASATSEASSAALEQADAMAELANTVDDMAMQLTFIRK